MSPSRLVPTDTHLLQQLIGLYAKVFEHAGFTMPSLAHLQSLLANDKMIFIAAIDGDEVVGGLTAHILPSVYAVSPELYLYDLAVAPAHQRRGIGMQLLQQLRSTGTQLSCSVLFVQADIEDVHAQEFYQCTGGRRADVVHYSYEL